MTPTKDSLIPFEALDIKNPEKVLVNLNEKLTSNYLGALFLLRETLSTYWEKGSEDLQQFDAILSAALISIANVVGPNNLRNQAISLGWVNNETDITQLTQSLLVNPSKILTLGNKETLSDIPIIGIVGKIASGKGIAAEILSQQFDVLPFPLSNRLRSIALTMGFTPPYTREQLRTINDIYKPTFGKQIFVEWTMSKATRIAKLNNPQIVVVDGFRSVTETEFFLNQPNTHLAAIVASNNPNEDRQVRFQRQKERRRGKEDSLTLEEFMKDDQIESAWIDPVIELARKKGLIIINDRNLDILQTTMMTTLRGVLPQ